MVRTRPLIVAHRGFSGRFPENTIRAFQEALKLPVDAIELDVRTTADSVLVVIHDETVDRTTNGSGRVRDLTWDEIRHLDAGIQRGEKFAGERIPSLDEALETIQGKTMLLVEIKETGTEERIIKVLDRHAALEWVTLVSFHADAIAAAKKIAPQISCMLIGGRDIGSSDAAFSDFVRAALNSYANAVTVHYAALTEERIRYCHQHHLFVGTWTVDEEDLAEKLVLMGADEIATNFPDILLAMLTA
ncbi:MAG: glycerophosphodiester phosphodiesterase [Actinobacteria bacterium]|nr:glycerophosphodiester phosphodiesterase [Actinomycetota bacterium]